MFGTAPQIAGVGGLAAGKQSSMMNPTAGMKSKKVIL
jgi:hypothetical protein